MLHIPYGNNRHSNGHENINPQISHSYRLSITDLREELGDLWAFEKGSTYSGMNNVPVEGNHA
jgi:hypothetical protein